ncbi:DUF2637 domain-containing protein [Nonomuraea turkmeniaca]|uniref:DUF2637 domain-containing protein n=1 Tax=Nonomuraea turkmeniaca TaxID=103838 RepID=UPI001FEA8A05|nr:DUF2637 domain-containing protein [Nonomuraea turkmeniaca]
MLLVALIAAVVSFRHMHELALLHGEDPLAAALIPLAVDGTIVAASISLLLASRYGSRGGVLPWGLLIIASLASLGANVAVAEPSLIGRVIAAWPSLALIGAYEMLMSQIRRFAKPRNSGDDPGSEAAAIPPRRRAPDRALQQHAWRWAQTNLLPDGELSSGEAIAEAFERSARWGRLVKKSGLAGELG